MLFIGLREVSGYRKRSCQTYVTTPHPYQTSYREREQERAPGRNNDQSVRPGVSRPRYKFPLRYEASLGVCERVILAQPELPYRFSCEENDGAGGMEAMNVAFRPLEERKKMQSK